MLTAIGDIGLTHPYDAKQRSAQKTNDRVCFVSGVVVLSRVTYGGTRRRTSVPCTKKPTWGCR